MGFARDVLGHYTITSPMAEHEVLAAGAQNPGSEFAPDNRATDR